MDCERDNETKVAMTLDGQMPQQDGETALPVADDELYATLRHTIRSQRKYGAKTYRVMASAMQLEGSDAGRTVVLTRDTQTGVLIDTSVRTLRDVLENGIPVPNLIEIATRT